MGITVSPRNDFQAAAIKLENAADALAAAAKEPLKAAGASVDRAIDHGADALGHADGALTNAVFALGHTGAAALWALDGVGEVADAGLHAAAGTAIGAVASGGWAVEQATSGVRLAFLQISKFFVGLANALSSMLGDPKSSLVTTALGDPNAQRLSEKLFDKAGDQFKLSADAMNFAWDSYAEAGHHLLEAGGHSIGSVVNAGYFAMHSAAMLGNLGLAAVQAGAAPVIKLAELGVRIAKLGVEYAEKGVEGARDLSLLAAEVTAAAGNALAHPDQAKYGVSDQTIAQFGERFAQIQAAA